MVTYLVVCHPVIVEVGGGGEAFTTDGTLMWLLARVNAAVGVQRG